MIRLLRTWWSSRTPRQRSWMQYAGPLIGLGVLLGLDWWYLHRKGETTPREAMILLRNVGWTLAVGAAVMVLGVRRWPLTMLGLLSLLLGFAGLLIRVVGGVGPNVGEAERDLIQACLEVGSRLLVIGIAIWIIGWVPANNPAWDGRERRNGHDRRSGWGRHE